MFFNAGRMGFRHFKIEVPPPGPGAGGGGTGCFGITGTDEIVFFFDNYSVPDKPAFSYIYSCSDAADCFQYGVDEPYSTGNPCNYSQEYEGSSQQIGGTYDIPAFDYCSCTGARARNLACWKERLNIASDCFPPVGSFELCNSGSGGVENEEFEDYCAGFPVGSVSGNPDNKELCDFCNSEEGGASGDSVQCGIQEVFTGLCNCTSRSEGADDKVCAENCDSITVGGRGCRHCRSSNGLAWLRTSMDPGEDCTVDGGATDYLMPDLVTGYTGWTGDDIYANNFITDFLSGNVCGTPNLPDGTKLAIAVTELAPDGSITDTSQIKPQNFLNISGHNCGKCSSGSAYQGGFSYLTVEEGVTFCNIFITPRISQECATGSQLIPERPGCTFCYAGITFETGSCVHKVSDRQNNGITEEIFNIEVPAPFRRCTSPYLSNMGCANGLARHYSLPDIPENPDLGGGVILNHEMRKFRRIDNSEIDTCGVNPCLTSEFFKFDGGGQSTGGFDGSQCFKYLGEREDPFPISVKDDGVHDIPSQGDPEFKRSIFYEAQFALCDEQSPIPPNGRGGTADLVVGVQSDRMTRANECVNRVGRRSEQMFDLPLVSVGTSRSFFAPWVDDTIHHVTTPEVSGRRLGGGTESNSDGERMGDRFFSDIPAGRPVINHLAMGPYPAYSYYSWFYGPMFDVSETMTKFRDTADFGSEYFGVNHAAINTRFEGQWGPNIFGKFLTHPGFIGTPDDTMRNLRSASRGYFDSWGDVRLNNFWKESSSVFTGGTLSKFTDTLTTGVEAFNNPNQNRKNIDADFGLASDSAWPPADLTNGYFIPVAGATASAGPLDHNPHGITAHSALGWCSAVNRQNSSWLNPRFTVASNWLWPGGRESYDENDYKMLLATATVDTGELTPREFRSEFGGEGEPPVPDSVLGRELNANNDNYNRGDEDAAYFFIDYRGRSRELPFGQIYTYSPTTFRPLPSVGTSIASMCDLGYGSDDETRVSPFAPLNRIFNVQYFSIPDDDSVGFFGNVGDGNAPFRNASSGDGADALCTSYELGQPCVCIPEDINAGSPPFPSAQCQSFTCPNGQSVNSIECLCDLCECWAAGTNAGCLQALGSDGEALTEAEMANLCRCCNGVGGANPIDGEPGCFDCGECIEIQNCITCQGGVENNIRCEGWCWDDPTQFNSDTADLHESFQFPATYIAYWNQPVWRPNASGLFEKYELDSSNDIVVRGYTGTSAMELHMSVNRYSNPTNPRGGNAFRRFGGFTNVKQTASPNQRFEGMDRYRLHMVLPSSASETGEGIDPERTVIPSPSLLSYYALPIIGGWGYAGPPSNAIGYDTLTTYRGVGNGRGFLYGPYGRDIIWADPDNFGLSSRQFRNPDGSAVTGPTRADRNQFRSTVSDFHSQRLFSNGGNSTNFAAVVDFPEEELEDILDVGDPTNRGEFSQGGYTASNFMSTATQCGNTAWHMIRAAHCLLDISTDAGKSGVLTIPSSFVGCTAYYKASGVPATNGSDAEAVYQFNGNGWWYRTHEQLRLGINEEGYTSGVGPAGWIRHQNGYFPNYNPGTSHKGDRMYGPAMNPTESPDGSDSGTIGAILEGTTFDSGHGFVQDVAANAEVTQIGISDFTSIPANSQLNNGWTACSPNVNNPTLDSIGYQRQFNEGHFPEIEAGYYPSFAGLYLDDTKMFDAVFAWESGSTSGVGLGGYFKLINQSGIDLTLRVTGGAASAAGSSKSNPINLNIEPFQESLNTFGETFDLMCQTDTDMLRPYLGNCSRMNDHTAGGYKVWPNQYLVNQIVGWVHPNAQG